jgi:hypothetical protein
LLEKARDFTEIAYSSTMSSYAFLGWARDRTQPGAEEGATMVDALEKAARLSDLLRALRQDISKLT